MKGTIFGRFDGEPALFDQRLAPRVVTCLQGLEGHPHAQAMIEAGAAADDGFWPDPASWMAAYRPYVVRDGILQIPVKGVLLHGFSFAVGSLATGYIYIQRAFDRGMADGQVKGIALLCDSPGGEVAGNFELADRIYAGRGMKPIRAFAHEIAYSAAYSLASAADQVVMSRTGGVGSIGVVSAHVDLSKALDSAGVKITFIFAGRHKVDGNAYEPLPEDVRARVQAKIDSLHDIFVATVARNRDLAPSAVRSTEALTYMAQEALANGLADSVQPFDDAVAAFAAELNPTEEDDQMTTKTDPAPAANGISQAEHEAALATARAEGQKAGAAAERSRITAIRAAMFQGQEALAERMIAEGTEPGEAAQAFIADWKEHGGQLAAIKGMDEKVKVPANPSTTGEVAKTFAQNPEGWKAEWAASEQLQSEFGSAEAYAAYKDAEKGGRIRLKSNRAA